MRHYRNYINKATLQRSCSFGLRFVIVLFANKLLGEKDGNKYALFGYYLISINQLSGFGLPYFYIKSIKSGNTSLQEYFSNVFLVNIGSAVTITLIASWFLRLESLDILVLTMYVASEYLCLEIQRVAQVTDLDKGISFFPLVKNTIILCCLLIYYIMGEEKLIVLSVFPVLIGHVVGTMVAVLTVFRQELRCGFRFNKKLLAPSVFLNSFWYYISTAINSSLFTIDKKIVEINLQSADFYQYNIYYSFLSSFCGFLESVLLVKGYSAIYDNKIRFSFKIATVALIGAALVSILIQFILGGILKFAIQFSVANSLAGAGFIFLFIFNYFEGVSVYSSCSASEYSIVSLFLVLIYVLTAVLFTLWICEGAFWLTSLPISISLVYFFRRMRRLI